VVVFTRERVREEELSQGNIKILQYVIPAAGRRFLHIKGEINAQF
jgi:alpha-D-ribose 1-methylphosphonate 5-phosphate C-P lyase